MFENILAQLATVAAFVRQLITLVKPTYQDSAYQRYIDLGLSVAVSGALCVAWEIDAFAAAGIVIAALPWLGGALTGVLAGLGANVLNDVLVLLEMWKNQKKVEVATAVVDLQVAEEIAAEYDEQK